MLKNGTKYLALVKFTNDELEWIIVYWGVAVGISDPHGIPGWINNGLKLRDPEFLEFFELNNVLDIVKRNKFENRIR